MSIRRKNTTHDLATLRLHPDGSRVQQSSVNARRRTARSTLVDSRGNWIAKDAGGKASVKTRRSVSGAQLEDGDGEFIDLSGDETRPGQSKGKQRARDSQIPDEDPQSGRLNTRTRRRLSFLRDLSFLDPPPASVSSLERDANHSGAASAREPIFSFSDPAPDLLKSIHHFASCYYRERGQLSDSSRDYRGRKREQRKQSPRNVHALAAKTVKHDSIDLGTEDLETEESTGVDDEISGVEDSGKEGSRTKGDDYAKDMYKALDGSALMAIGIVLQEYVAHTLSSAPRTAEAPSPKRPRRE